MASDNSTSRLKNGSISYLTLLCACMQFGCSAAPAAASNEELFKMVEVSTPEAEHQTILPGFFSGSDTAEFIVLSTFGNGRRQLDMFAFDGGAWVPKLTADFSADALFVDIVSSGEQDRLISFERGGMSWIDPLSGEARRMQEFSFRYDAAGNQRGSATRPGGEIPHVDVSRDLNKDGRDDLIIPDFDGFWVATQRPDGSFTAPLKLGPAEPFLDLPVLDHERSYRALGITAGTIPVYLTRAHEMDHDQDGRSDLVFWNTDHFDVYHQNESGTFSPDPVEFRTDVPFDSDGIYTRVADFGSEGVLSMLIGLNENSSRTVLHSLRDLNADGVIDLVTLTLTGRTMLRQRSLYQVHFGKESADGIAFAAEANAVISPTGRAGALQPWGYSSQVFQDVDADGQLDVMFRDVRVGFGGMTRAMVGNSVPIDLEFYRLKNGAYPNRAAARHKIRRFSPLAGVGNVFLPCVMLGDVDGDGHSDLLVGQNPNELRVFLGTEGAGMFSRRASKISVALPSDERKSSLMDINHDGKQDVIITAGPTEQAPDTPRGFTTLIAL